MINYKQTYFLAKRQMRSLSALIIYIMFCSTMTAQQDDTLLMIRYSPDFEFKDGIFLNFDQVQQNNPIPISLIISPVAFDDPDFYDRILIEKTVRFFDDLGSAQEILVQDIWGYSHSGTLYININNGFYRITIIGNICHFVANVTTYDRYYNSYNPYISPYYYPYSPYTPYSNNMSTEMRQYLLDFMTGEVMDYDVPELEVLLMSDPELHDEFVSLSKRKKKQQKFLYIRKFNERNPLFFPRD